MLINHARCQEVLGRHVHTLMISHKDSAVSKCRETLSRLPSDALLDLEVTGSAKGLMSIATDMQISQRIAALRWNYSSDLSYERLAAAIAKNCSRLVWLDVDSLKHDPSEFVLTVWAKRPLLVLAIHRLYRHSYTALFAQFCVGGASARMYIGCDDSDLSSGLRDFLAKDALEYLEIQGSGVSASALAAALKNAKKLRTLHCFRVNAVNFELPSSVLHLGLHQCAIGAAAVERVADWGFLMSSSVTRLHFSPESRYGRVQLLKAIGACPTKMFERVHLASAYTNDLTPGDLCNIAHLDISSCYPDFIPIVAGALALPQCRLRELVMCVLVDEGSDVLDDGLELDDELDDELADEAVESEERLIEAFRAGTLRRLVLRGNSKVARRFSNQEALIALMTHRRDARAAVRRLPQDLMKLVAMTVCAQ